MSPPALSDPALEVAAPADLPAVVALMNAAYREAPPGWASESGLLGGQRTDPATLAADTAAGTHLLVHRDGNALLASVQLREASPAAGISAASPSPQPGRARASATPSSARLSHGLANKAAPPSR